MTAKRTFVDTASKDTYVVGNDATVFQLAGKSNGDTIAIEGFAGDYSARVNGRKITLVNEDGQKIIFQVASGGTVNLKFLDGELSASLAADAKGKLSAKIGDQALSAKAVAIDDTDLTGDNGSADLFAPVSYSVKAASGSVNEGANATFTLTTTGVDAGTAVEYKIAGVSADDVQGGERTGYAVIGADGTATINVGVRADATTEGAETMTVVVEGKAAAVTINDTSVGGSTGSTYAITADAASVNEGSIATFTLKTTGLDAGSAVEYKIGGITAPDVTGGALSGFAIVDAAGIATISVPIAKDQLSEGAEKLYAVVNGKAATITVNDTSRTVLNAALTDGQDTSAAFTGDTENDTFTASESTLTAGDSLVGGAGEDTLNLNVTLGADETLKSFVLNTIENVDISITDDDAGATNTLTVNLLKSSADMVTVSGQDSDTGNADVVALTKVGKGVSLAMQDVTNLQLDAQYVDAATSGDSDSVTVTLNNVASDAAGDTTLTVGDDGGTGSGFETINLVTTGDASVLGTLVTDGVATLNVSGTQDLEITADLADDITTVDASGLDGGLTVVMGAGADNGETAADGTTDIVDLTITTGSGDDNIDASAVVAAVEMSINLGDGDDTLTLAAEALDSADDGATVGDVLNGGDGTDTLVGEIALVDGIAALTGVSGFEVLEISDDANGADLIVADVSADIKRVDLSEKIGGDASITFDTGSYTVGLNAEDALDGHKLTVAAGGDGTADTLTIVNMLSDKGDIGNAGSIDASGGFETVTIDTGDYGDNDAEAQTLTDVTLDADATLKIVGTNDLDLTGAVIAAVVDASGMSGSLTIDADDDTDVIHGGSGDDDITTGTGTADAGGVLVRANAGDDQVTGDSGDDTIYGGDGDDTLDAADGDNQIYGDAGDDEITGGTGDDVLAGGDGDDTIDASDGGADSVTGGTGNDKITVDDLTDQTIDGGAGIDTLVLTTAIDKTNAADLARVTSIEAISVADDQDMSFFSGSTIQAVTITAAAVISEAGSAVATLNVDIDGDAELSRAADTSSDSLTINALTENTGNTITVDNEEALTIVALEDDGETTTEVDTTLVAYDLTKLTLVDGTKFTIAFDKNGDGDNTGTKLATIDATGISSDAGIDIDASGSTVGVTFTVAATEGDVVLTTGTGADNLNASGVTGDVTFTSGKGNDTLIGGAGGDDLNGGEGADSLVGGAGADDLDGGAGSDTLSGGAGDDTYKGDTGVDWFYVTAGTDTVSDLGGGTVKVADVLIVSSGATAEVTVSSNYTASANTSNAGTVEMTLAAAITKVDLSLATGSKGYTVTSDTGGDTTYIIGSKFNDVIDLAAATSKDGTSVHGGTGADTITLGAADDTVMYTAVESETGLSATTIDSIDAFTTGADILKLGVAGIDTAGADTNFVEADYTGAGLTDKKEFAAALAAANTALEDLATTSAGDANYAFIINDNGAADGDAYLFIDSDLDGVADAAIKLVGLETGDLVFGDITA